MLCSWTEIFTGQKCRNHYDSPGIRDLLTAPGATGETPWILIIQIEKSLIPHFTLNSFLKEIVQQFYASVEGLFGPFAESVMFIQSVGGIVISGLNLFSCFCRRSFRVQAARVIFSPLIVQSLLS